MFQTYQIIRDQAHLIGDRESRGCCQADSYDSVPFQRMPNVMLEAGQRPMSLDDLLSGVDDGVLIDGNGEAGQNDAQNLISHNFIGMLRSALAAGNGKNGVRLNDSSGNVIGPENLIAFNQQSGVAVTKGANGESNRVTQNRIYSNGGLGIDLGQNGVTANDPGDADPGANRLQNFPELNAYGGGLAAVRITLDSFPSRTFTGRLEQLSQIGAISTMSNLRVMRRGLWRRLSRAYRRASRALSLGGAGRWY